MSYYDEPKRAWQGQREHPGNCCFALTRQERTTQLASAWRIMCQVTLSLQCAAGPCDGFEIGNSPSTNFLLCSQSRAWEEQHNTQNTGSPLKLYLFEVGQGIWDISMHQDKKLYGHHIDAL